MSRLSKGIEFGRFARSAILVLILFGATGCDLCDKTSTTSSTFKEHELFVKTSGGYCTVTDADGNIELTVERGDWITWKNEFGSDVQLDFSQLKRLLGVYKAVVYTSGEGLRLRVRLDAEYGDHPYSPGCGTTQPGPKIIVNPPN